MSRVLGVDHITRVLAPKVGMLMPDYEMQEAPLGPVRAV
jgi:hypothetical protein